MSAVAEQTQLLADRINALEESSTLAMTKKARELAAEGHKVISLSVGEPDFKTPAHICEAAKKAIDDGFHGYSPVAGYPDLRKAIADKLKRDNNIDWKPENIVAVSYTHLDVYKRQILYVLLKTSSIKMRPTHWTDY